MLLRNTSTRFPSLKSPHCYSPRPKLYHLSLVSLNAEFGYDGCLLFLDLFTRSEMMLHCKVISKIESQAVLNQHHKLGRKAELEDEVQKKEELLDKVP